MVKITRRTAPPHGRKRNYRSHYLKLNPHNRQCQTWAGRWGKGTTEIAATYNLNFYKILFVLMQKYVFGRDGWTLSQENKGEYAELDVV